MFGKVVDTQWVANFYNIADIGVFIRRGGSSWVFECENDEVLLVTSDFWLSTGGFSSGGAGQVGSLGNRDVSSSFYNMGGIGVFIDWNDSPWVVECETDEVLLVRSWFWLSTGGFSSGGAGQVGSVGNRDVTANSMNMGGIVVFID